MDSKEESQQATTLGCHAFKLCLQNGVFTFEKARAYRWLVQVDVQTGAIQTILLRL